MEREDIMAFDLPALPYAKNALEPYTSAQTLDFHHGKHHQAYVTNLNNLVKDTPLASRSLEELIKSSYKDDSKTGIFNNAAQVWNHSFFWNCMKPGGGGAPTGAVVGAIERDLAALPSSRTISRRRRSDNLAAAGPGSSRTAASSRSPARPTP
jgi:superoxide dismutase, Fe-Mn family